MGERVERYFIPTLIGFAPVIFALLTAAPEHPSSTQSIILLTAAPVVVAELFAIVVALREGLLTFIRHNGPPSLALAALAVWLVIAIGTAFLAAPAREPAVRWTVHWIIHLAFGFSVAWLCCRSLKIRDLIDCYIAGFLVYVLIFFVFVVVHWNHPIDWVHNLPAAIHIRHVGIYAAGMTGIAIGALVRARSRSTYGILFATVTIGFALGLWTGSRGMVASVIGATILGAVMVPAMRSIRVLGTAAAALGIAIGVVALLPVPNGNMMGVARAVAATTQHEMTTGRLQIWTNVAHAIIRHPVFGYGPGQMPIVAPYYTMGQPHNFVLQVLLDWGVAGFVCVLVLAFFYLRWAIPALRQQGDRLGAPFMGMLSILALSMIDAAMFHVLPVSIFAACAGMIAGSWERRTAEKPQASA